MIAQGLTITLIGMTTVFVLLGTLVLFMMTLEKLVIFLDKHYPQSTSDKQLKREMSKNIFKATSIALAHHFNKK